MRSDWRRLNYLRILGSITVIIGIGIALWHIPIWIQKHPHEDWSPLYYGFTVCVAGLITLIFSKDVRDMRSIFLVQIMGYFALYLAIRFLYFFMPFSLSLYLVVAASLIGLIHFVLGLLLKRSRTDALFSALRVFLFFSAYSMFFYGRIGCASIFALFPEFSEMFIPLVIVSTIATLPEISCFLAVCFARKKRIALCIISAAIAAFLLLELFPVRNAFIHAMEWDVPLGLLSTPGSYGQPIGEQGVEQEFVRSLSTIDRLLNQARADSLEDLTTITLNLPKLEKHPKMLNREWFSEYLSLWSPDYQPEFFARFFTQETPMLNLRRDSDNDGLSDFYEAILLCDADDPDTDNDGFEDSEDSDPRHAYRESIYGHINTAIISFSSLWQSSGVDDRSAMEMSVLNDGTVFSAKKELPFVFVNNEFPDGHGEIANFGGHAIILDRPYFDMWHKIFGSCSDVWDCTFIGQYALSAFRLFAVVRVTHDWDYGGIEEAYLTVRWRDKWIVTARSAISCWIR